MRARLRVAVEGQRALCWLQMALCLQWQAAAEAAGLVAILGSRPLGELRVRLAWLHRLGLQAQPQPLVVAMPLAQHQAPLCQPQAAQRAAPAYRLQALPQWRFLVRAAAARRALAALTLLLFLAAGSLASTVPLVVRGVFVNLD